MFISHQLPVKRASGENSFCADVPAVVLSLCLDADCLEDLTQVNEVPELGRGIVTAENRRTRSK